MVLTSTAQAVLLSNGRVLAWGTNAYGVLGPGPVETAQTPQILSLPEPIVRLEAPPTGYTTYALSESGTVYE
ncbi:MAG: hypothetical protein ACOX2L_05465 [Anaerolineae bacterium]